MHELTHQAHYLWNVSETVKENNSLPPTPTITTKLIGVALLRVAGIADSGAVVWFGALLLFVINLPNTPNCPFIPMYLQ